MESLKRIFYNYIRFWEINEEVSFLFFNIHNSTYIVDVLWCQPIKLIQVFSTSDIDFIFFVPSKLKKYLLHSYVIDT